MPNFSIGVDLGGTNLRIAAATEQGSLMEKVTLGTKTILGRDQVLNDMCGAIRHISDKYKDSANLLGVGIGVPGIIDMQTGMMRESPNLPGWADYPVRAEIEKRLGAVGTAVTHCPPHRPVLALLTHTVPTLDDNGAGHTRRPVPLAV